MPSTGSSTGSRIDGSSFSGLFTRVEIGHIVMGSDGKGTRRSRGVRIERRQPAVVVEGVCSFLRSYCEQWPNATLFETIDMAYRTGAKSWDPAGGPKP
jgi:hypothetical protein